VWVRRSARCLLALDDADVLRQVDRLEPVQDLELKHACTGHTSSVHLDEQVVHGNKKPMASSICEVKHLGLGGACCHATATGSECVADGVAGVGNHTGVAELDDRGRRRGACGHQRHQCSGSRLRSASLWGVRQHHEDLQNLHDGCTAIAVGADADNRCGELEDVGGVGATLAEAGGEVLGVDVIGTAGKCLSRSHSSSR